MRASHSFLQKSKFYIEGGLLLVIVALLGLSNYFITTLNVQLSQNSTWKIAYVALIAIACAVFAKRNMKNLDKELHPILIKVKKYFIVHYAGLALIIAILLSQGLKELLMPAFFIFYGIHINLIGRFSHKPIQYSSWIYIIFGGLVGILLAKGIMAHSEILTSIEYGFVGICHLVVGILIRKNENK